jgi:hypothetical protein
MGPYSENRVGAARNGLGTETSTFWKCKDVRAEVTFRVSLQVPLLSLGNCVPAVDVISA